MKLYLIMVAFVLQPVFLGELPEYGGPLVIVRGGRIVVFHLVAFLCDQILFLEVKKEFLLLVEEQGSHDVKLSEFSEDVHTVKFLDNLLFTDMVELHLPLL